MVVVVITKSQRNIRYGGLFVVAKRDQLREFLYENLNDMKIEKSCTIIKEPF